MSDDDEPTIPPPVDIPGGRDDEHDAPDRDAETTAAASGDHPDGPGAEESVGDGADDESARAGGDGTPS
ncbi:MAG: hypothetical protein ACRCYR_14445 [Phycicoccus sp.]